MNDDKLSPRVRDAIQHAERARKDYPTHFVSPAVFDIMRDELYRLTAENAEMRARAEKAAGYGVDVEAVREAIPHNWCDPLLTGPKAVIGESPYNGRDIERLLTALRNRLARATGGDHD